MPGIPSPIDIGQALDEARPHIAPRDAHVLLRHVTGLSDAALIARPETLLSATQTLEFRQLVRSRMRGEPIAYLVGKREFFGLDFQVTPAVLIPRPETELLVEVALEQLASHPGARVLDLGTGSGCIAITIAKIASDAYVTGVDASAQALIVAKENAARLQVRVRWLEGSWYWPVAGARFDLIVSNPPYIAGADPHLEEGDLLFEPRCALTDEVNGLSALRQIIAGAPAALEPGGRLAVEHGYDQADAVDAMFQIAGFAGIRHFQDLAGIPRVVLGRLPEGISGPPAAPP